MGNLLEEILQLPRNNFFRALIKIFLVKARGKPEVSWFYQKDPRGGLFVCAENLKIR